jgi:thiol-disulfide isomerase/thioredoxin
MKQNGVFQLAFIALAAVVVYFFVGAARNDRRRASCNALCAFSPDYAGRNRTAPDFELKDAKGRVTQLSAYRGKTVFLNFWASWCDPCMAEMPALADFARSLEKRDDMVLITVNVDQDRQIADDKLQVTLGGPPPFLVLYDPELAVVDKKYGTRAFPETWVIDPKGVIRARFDGPRDWSGALPIEIGKMIAKPSTCPMEFYHATPRGPFAGLCEDDG